MSKGQLGHTCITQWRTSCYSRRLLLLAAVLPTRFFLWGLLSAVFLKAGCPSLALDGHVRWYRVVVVIIIIKNCSIQGQLLVTYSLINILHYFCSLISILLLSHKKSITCCTDITTHNALIPGGGSGEMGELAEAAPRPPVPLLVVDEEEEDWRVAWGEGASSPRMTRRW